MRVSQGWRYGVRSYARVVSDLISEVDVGDLTEREVILVEMAEAILVKRTDDPGEEFRFATEDRS